MFNFVRFAECLNKQMKIDFYLRFRTYMGQSVSITGSLAILGHNERNHALPMNFLTEDYWHVSIELDELFKDEIEYRYLRKLNTGIATPAAFH